MQSRVGLQTGPVQDGLVSITNSKHVFSLFFFQHIYHLGLEPLK